MSLLTLEHVIKRYREGPRERLVLDNVSLEIEPGELRLCVGRTALGANDAAAHRRRHRGA